ncbi:MAG TPA: AraC family transcriptional regulator, partial [Kineosporiaceae bacterium]|nr:AraC family transcriptional regulator [Kineosporiaceae bacterium]
MDHTWCAVHHRQVPDNIMKRSTSEVDPARSFEYWRDLICDTFVQLSASPVGDRSFVGQIEHVHFGGLDLSTVRAGGQSVRRTPRLISRSNEAFLLASIQTQGSGLVIQDGRTASLVPGSMAFYDSTRPYTLHFEDAFEQIVVRVPLDEALAMAGTRRPLDVTARVLDRQGVGGVVADFFRSLALAQQHDPDGAGDLAEAAGVLLTSALSLAGGGVPAVDGGVRLRREQVIAYLRRNLDNPRLDAEVIAAALFVSRRTLFRAFAGEPGGVVGLLRQMRVERAQRLLRASPGMPVRVVAAECGFAGEVQFHRTFR